MMGLVCGAGIYRIGDTCRVFARRRCPYPQLYIPSLTILTMRNSIMLALYSCPACNKMTLIVQDGEGTLVCCGKPMVRLEEKSTEAGKEKHLPVITKVPGGIRVNVGSIPHPMEKEHSIRWIEVIGDTFLYTATLSPGDKPEREFMLPKGGKVRKVRIFSNLHGAWATKP
jgi:superoxide reductase